MSAASMSPLERSGSGELSEIVDTILDKGLVIDAFVRVSLVGIEVLTVQAKVVVASIETYLRYAEAMARLEVGRPAPQTRPGLVGEVAEGVMKGALGAVQQVAPSGPQVPPAQQVVPPVSGSSSTGAGFPLPGEPAKEEQL